ncbi:MAG: hypothetical protein IJI67_01275 [Clostridia bacterium]|nr:hypothetical protein [Clostridia bacterium]
MKKTLIAVLVLALCLSFFACSKNDSKSESKSYFSLEELVNDPEFQKAISDSDDDVFKTSVSADSDKVLVFRVDVQKTYDAADVEFLQSKTDDEISEKFALADLQKFLKSYGFGDVTIEFKMYNGDGALITERTFPPVGK